MDRSASTRTATARAATDEGTTFAELAEDGPPSPPPPDADGEEEVRSTERVHRTLELLSDYSEERHPGHEPGRFAGPGPEYDGMFFDGLRWQMKRDGDGGAPSTALALLSEHDQVLATRFESEGGTALLLSSAFTLPNQLREEAKKLLQTLPKKEDADPSDGDNGLPADDAEVSKAAPGSDAETTTQSTVQQAILLMQAADMAEDREAVMRNVWSDVEFHAGDLGNAELVQRMEMQFANQLVQTAEVRLGSEKTRADAKPEAPLRPQEVADNEPDIAAFDEMEPAYVAPEKGQDGLFQVVLRDCEQANDLVQRLPPVELTKTLKEPRNLGVALDLVGAYLKNYEIDKADLVLQRVVPLCRERGGPWLVKALDKLCLVRMKQFRAYDALVSLKEIEKLAPFTVKEGWEFHDILYRNFAWCYAALDEPERCLEYTSKSADVKRACGIQVTWFDIWDLGKSHARLGQKMKQREEMRVGYELCCKAGEIHRTAEASDRIMLAKILSNVGEVAMGVGDSYYMEGSTDDAREWYEKAQAPLREAYELHESSLGPMKPLTGWQAGTMAHCMVRLERFEEARSYLALALKVECTKDSTTPGAVVELVDRVMGVHHELGDHIGMAAYVDDFYTGLAGLRAKGWDRRERDVFAYLLQKISNVLLVADGGTGRMASRALELLREADTHLTIHLQATKGGSAFHCEVCGKKYTAKEDLDAHMSRRHSHSSAQAGDRMDVAPKKFGPRAEDNETLLRSIRTNIQVLELTERVEQQNRFEEIKEEAEGREAPEAAFAGATAEAEPLTAAPEEPPKPPPATAAEEPPKPRWSVPTGLGSSATATEAPSPGAAAESGRPQPSVEAQPPPPRAPLQQRQGSVAAATTFQQRESKVGPGGLPFGLQDVNGDVKAIADALRGLSEPDPMALARSYALVGSWSAWKEFDDLARDTAGGPVHTASVLVDASKDIEFQVICDRNWKQRLFPAVNGAAAGRGIAILGPAAAGHGHNWRIRKARRSSRPVPATLRVTLDPTGVRSMECDLELTEDGYPSEAMPSAASYTSAATQP